ncbi:unnamed protein product [Thlaspi arvense]|uniref:Importin N-terminal domain-containing protein n=1 Tax=Thlaspi arvense TaxID=13288 RepID=A0AAU9S1S3_THLAR|nr:unnamed protein product [Thlaspi arvense]
MAAEKLRDLSQPIDVVLLDATVEAFYATGSKEERASADNILRDLKANPDTWLQVVHILQSTRSTHTKYFALQVLEGVIKYRWNALPVEQRDGMKNYISEVIVQLSRDEASFRSERLYVNKLNVILVQIVKHEWPVKWRSFIPDLVKAAKTSETICENCMTILKLLSEEVFDFSRGEMTQQKIKELKHEFQLVHELCLYVLSASQRPELIRATLSALHAYLSWIPLGYIFESPLLETLLKFFPVSAYRNLTLQCLSEVAALNFGNGYNAQYVQMYTILMNQLQDFIQNLALFFTSFFKLHIKVLESTPENISLLLAGLGYLIGISYVDDTEVFKVCLDYWNSLVLELFGSHHHVGHPALTPSLFGYGLQMAFLPRTVDGIKFEATERQKLYSDPMSKLRGLMISRMAKPEEVLIVEDENGNIVRETMKDNDVLVQYKIMRETLIYLSHLDHDDTERQMLSKLSKQLSGEEWTWNNLNTLCWAIGSISGSMDVEQENRFLVMVIRDLLSLCEIVKGKDNKAVIASNIMYVVGQYSRFLRAHWKFLKTVVHKLFEFMHETHPGVQDMACDTFLKIVQKCKRKFVIVQVGENEPFVSELLSGLATIVGDLEPHQIHTFYESVGTMIQAESDPEKRGEYIQRLMALPNQKWAEIIGQARQSADTLKDPDMIRTVLNILQTNTRVATSLGTHFLSQISLIFLDMLNVYRMYSELVSSNIANGGPYASRTSVVKLLRYKNVMQNEVPRIFEAVFQCTLEMITKNFEDYPEHRLKFFSLLRAIATFCFPALIQLSSEQLKLVMDSVIWAFRHTERNIAETGLNLLIEMLRKFQKSGFSNQFYRTYFMQIEQEIFAVLTDTFHKPGFKLHVLVLQHLFSLVESGSLTEPLWDATTVPHQYPNNAAFVREYTIKLLGSSFPNMTASEVTQFVNGLYESRSDLARFKNKIRDFLVQSKEFSAQDNKDLYAEEAAAQVESERQRMLSIPGLVAPNEIQDEMADS